VEVVLHPLVVLHPIVVSRPDPRVHPDLLLALLVSYEGSWPWSEVKGKTFLPFHSLKDALNFRSCVASPSWVRISGEHFGWLLIAPDLKGLIIPDENIPCAVVNKHTLKVWNALLIAKDTIHTFLPHVKVLLSLLFGGPSKLLLLISFQKGIIFSYRLWPLFLVTWYFICLIFINLNLEDIACLKVYETRSKSVHNKDQGVCMHVEISVSLHVVADALSEVIALHEAVLL